MENNHFDIPSFTLSDFRRIARRKLNGRWGTALLPAVIIILVVLLPQIFEYTSVMLSSAADLQNGISLTDYLYSTQTSSESSTALDTILWLFQLFFTGAFEVSMAILCLRILRNEEISPSVAVSGLKQFGQSLGISLLVAVYSALWSMVTILPGSIILVLAISTASFPVILLGSIVFVGAMVGYIARVLRYGMVYFIAADDPTLPVGHVIRSSIAIMKGSLGRYFLLQLTFLGWSLLASIPFGLGMGFLYINQSTPSMGLSLAAYGLIAVGCFTIALLNLYLNTALAVFYSTLSGNIRPKGVEESPESVDGEMSGESSETPVQIADAEWEKTPEEGAGEELSSIRPVDDGPVRQDPSETIVDESRGPVEAPERLEPTEADSEHQED